MSEIVKGILRAVSSGLQIPTIIILILLILLTIVMLGSFFAELLTERRTLKLNIPRLVDDLQGKSTAEMKDVIAASSLLTRQKSAVQELISRVNYPEDTREALARQLIADEETRYNRIIKITDLTARVAPMFGLMGTLIPLGPGLIALGEGDAATLSDSLLIAFDTTVAGLISGALSYIVSGFRKGWYEEYMIGLETIMETVLDVQNTERGKAAEKLKEADAAKAAGQAGIKKTTTMSRDQAAQVQAKADMTPGQAARPAGQAQAVTPGQAGQMAHPAQPGQAVRPTAQAGQAQVAQAGQAQAAQMAQAQAAQMAQAQMAQPHPAQPGQAVRPTAQPQALTAEQAAQVAQAAQAMQASQHAQPAQAAQAARPAQPQAAHPAQPAQQRPPINSMPTFAQATSKTIAGYDAQQLQAGVRAAEQAMQKSEAAAAKAKEMEQIQSLDDLLESFSPTDGRQ